MFGTPCRQPSRIQRNDQYKRGFLFKDNVERDFADFLNLKTDKVMTIYGVEKMY